MGNIYNFQHENNIQDKLISFSYAKEIMIFSYIFFVGWESEKNAFFILNITFECENENSVLILGVIPNTLQIADIMPVTVLVVLTGHCHCHLL